MKGKLRFSPLAVGGASLLVSIFVLCLTVFALLSLTSAQTEQRLSRRAVQTVTDYYQADAWAEELLARLKNGEIPPEITEIDGIYTYSCPISQHQTLFVAVQPAGEDWRILQWQVQAHLPEGEEEPVELWDGTILTEERVP